MARRTKRKSKKALKIIGVLLCFAAIAAAVYFYLQSLTPTQEESNTESTQTTSQKTTIAEDTTKTTTTESSSNNDKKDGIEIIDESDPNNSETITGSITRASETSKGSFRIVATTDQALSEGTCKITFSHESTILTASADIVVHPNASACTFDFDNNEIVSGTWNISVQVSTTGNRSGTISSSVEVTK